MIAQDEDRLWRSFAVADGCWPWLLSTSSSGYGQIKLQGKQYQAHRVMYKYVFGFIPNGLVIDHRCNNRGCVNPAHLMPVTIKENVLRGVGRAALFARQELCKRGHLFDYVAPSGRRRCTVCDNARRKGGRL